MWYTIGEEGRGRSPWPYFFLLDLLDLLSRFVLTIRQMAVTIASSASERSLIISLTDSFICCSPPFYDLIIARIYVLIKGNITILQGFLHLLIDGKCFFLTQNIGYESEVNLMAKGKYEYWLTPEGLLKLEAWARDGLTDEQIASNAGITAKTLYEWKKQYSEICESLKRGKAVVDIQVENALLKRALGYSYEEKKVEVSEEGTKVTKIIKDVIPDTTAQIFWLKNRRPDRWRDKQDIEHSGQIGGVMIIDDIPKSDTS